jgi:hypothetical protein
MELWNLPSDHEIKECALMKENIFAGLVPQLRNALLAEPRCREAVIKWATQPGRSAEQEIEHALMVEALVGIDFTGPQGNR